MAHRKLYPITALVNRMIDLGQGSFRLRTALGTTNVTMTMQSQTLPH